MLPSRLKRELLKRDRFQSQSHIRIAPIEEEDLPALDSLNQQLHQHEGELERMATALELGRRDPNHLLLGAKVAGALVGTVLGYVCRMVYGQGRPFMMVDGMVVDERHRRTGIGRALMEAIEERAWERDCTCILLVTDESRTDALRFYEALGYRADHYKAFKKSL